jgi:hypothetical protein
MGDGPVLQYNVLLSGRGNVRAPRGARSPAPR